MPVLVEAFSVITRRDRIEECYPGGVEGFFRDCPNRTACADDHAVRVGFMDPDSVRRFIATLGDSGLVHRDDHGHAHDIVVINQGQGPTTPCDWAEVFAVSLAGATVEVCRLTGTHSPRLACPAGWRPEQAAQHGLVYVPATETASRMEFLREENGLTVCRDRVTGRIMYTPSTCSSRPAEPAEGATSLCREKPWSIWQALRSLFRNR